MDVVDFQTDFLQSLSVLFGLFWILIFLSPAETVLPCRHNRFNRIFWLGFTVLELLNLVDLWFPGSMPVTTVGHAVWFTLSLVLLSPLPLWPLGRDLPSKLASLWPLFGMLTVWDGDAYGPLFFVAVRATTLIHPLGSESGVPRCTCQRTSDGGALLLGLAWSSFLLTGNQSFWGNAVITLVLYLSLINLWNVIIRQRLPSAQASLPEKLLSGRYTVGMFSVIILFMVIVTHGIGMLSQRTAERDFKQDLVLISLALPHQEVIQLSGTPTDQYNPVFRKVAGLLRQIQQKLPKVQRIYLVRRYLGRVLVFADSQPLWAADYRPPGTFIDLPLVNHEDAFRYDGPGVFGTTANGNSTLVSLLIPYRPTDHLPLVLGMDILYQDWLHQIRINKVFPILLSFILLFFLGAFTWIGRGAWIDRQRLRDSESKLRIAMESTDIVLWTWPDSESSPAEVFPPLPRSIGQWLAQIPHPQRSEALRSLKTHFRGQSREFEAVYPVTDPSGKVRWFLDRGKILERDPDGKPVRMAGVRLDITQRRLITERERQAERQLFAAQKLESLGILASGVAHDFNNILTAVLGNIEMAEMDMESEPDQARKHLTIAQRAVERAADLTKQMLAFAGKSPTRLKAVVLNDLILDQLQLWRSTIKPNITLREELVPIPALQADPTHIEQILMNLILNASDAIGYRKGTITVRSSSANVTQADLSRFIHFDSTQEGEYVIVEVEDNGPGIPPKILERVFDPFFSTKFTGRGLGLAAVLGLVRYYNGWIRVKTQVGVGTVFSIGLPVLSRLSNEPESD